MEDIQKVKNSKSHIYNSNIGYMGGNTVIKSVKFNRSNVESVDIKVDNTKAILEEVKKDNSNVMPYQERQNMLIRLSKYYKTDNLNEICKKITKNKKADDDITIYSICTYLYVIKKYSDIDDMDELIDACKDLINKDKDRMVLYKTPMLYKGDSETNIYLDKGRTQKYRYNGEFLLYYSNGGKMVMLPLANIKGNKDGTITSENLSDSDKKKIIKATTDYYYDIVKEQNKMDKTSKKLLSKYLNSMNFVYSTDSDNMVLLNNNAGYLTNNKFKSGDMTFRIDQIMISKKYMMKVFKKFTNVILKNKDKIEKARSLDKKATTIMKDVVNNGDILTDKELNTTKSELIKYFDTDKNGLYDKLKNYFKINKDLKEEDLIKYISIAKYKSKEKNIKDILNITDTLVKKDYGSNILYMCPTKKHGSIALELPQNDFGGLCEYEGDYLEYYNDSNTKVYAPLTNILTNPISGEFTVNDLDKDFEKKYIEKISKYYKNIMNTQKGYTPKLKKAIKDNLEDIDIIYSSNYKGIEALKDAAAYTGTFKNSNSNMVINADNILTGNKEFMINTYTHECGHVYSNYKNNFTDIPEWQQVYNDILCNKAISGIFDKYTISSKEEMFADFTMLYYTDPSKLKMADINVDYNGKHYSNAYEFMNDIYK